MSIYPPIKPIPTLLILPKQIITIAWWSDVAMFEVSHQAVFNPLAQKAPQRCTGTSLRNASTPFYIWTFSHRNNHFEHFQTPPIASWAQSALRCMQCFFLRELLLAKIGLIEVCLLSSFKILLVRWLCQQPHTEDSTQVTTNTILKMVFGQVVPGNRIGSEQNRATVQ